MNFKNMLINQIIKEEFARHFLNEDNLEMKKIAKDLYMFLKKIGVKDTKLTAAVPAKDSVWKQAVDFQRIGGSEDYSGGSALISYFPNSDKQIVIRIELVGAENGVLEVEKKFLNTWKNLEQIPGTRKISTAGSIMTQDTGAVKLQFDVIEKTTRKGGLAGNTQTNKPSGGNIF